MDEEKRARLRAEPQPGLLAAVKVADAILSAVAELHFEGDGPRADDEAESFLVAAYRIGVVREVVFRTRLWEKTPSTT